MQPIVSFFDYLRDNMKYSREEKVQREHFYSIVDEIDSCLIDEARTPLVISGAAEDKSNQYLAIDKLVGKLDQKDFEIDEKDKNILLTNEGINNVEKIFSSAGILKNNNLMIQKIYIWFTMLIKHKSQPLI